MASKTPHYRPPGWFTRNVMNRSVRWFTRRGLSVWGSRVLEVPGALSQGRTREEARENVLDALRTVLTPDEVLTGRPSTAGIERLRFIAA